MGKTTEVASKTKSRAVSEIAVLGCKRNQTLRKEIQEKGKRKESCASGFRSTELFYGGNGFLG